MLKKNFILPLIASFLMMASCSVYHPQAVDIPLINHEGDLRVDASLGMSMWLVPDAFHFNMTGTYGINNWLSAQAHANYGGDNYYAQLAPGAYLPLGGNAVLEGYLGVGYGGNKREDIKAELTTENSTNNDYNIDAHYILPFAQANIGWHDLTGANIDLGFGLKLGSYIPDITYTEVDNDGNVLAGTTETYTTPNFLVEPQLMMRLGSRNVKFNVKLGMTWMNDLWGSSTKFIYDWITGSVGITFAF